MLRSIEKSNSALGVELTSKWIALNSVIRNMNQVAIAFSGGVDSSLLAAAAFFELGENMVAIHIHSPVNSEEDFNDVNEIAKKVGFHLVVVEYDDLENPIFTANPPDRCYHCKLGRFQVIQKIAGQLGINHLLEGTNADDNPDDRPGYRAVIESGGHSPLRNVGLGKTDIRKLAQYIGLPNWNHPSAPCLATRFPYGIRLTAEGLMKIKIGERQLREWGFQIVRMRVHSNIVRLEIGEDQLNQAINLRKQIVSFFQKMGFVYITIDLAGYQSGSMNIHLD